MSRKEFLQKEIDRKILKTIDNHYSKQRIWKMWKSKNESKGKNLLRRLSLKVMLKPETLSVFVVMESIVSRMPTLWILIGVI